MSSGGAASGRYQAPALEKGLDILELLACEPGELTQNQVAARLGRTASEIFRMLDVLERRGYVARSPHTGGYALTLALFDLAHRQAPVHRLLSAALPVMRALARDTRQANHLAVQRDDRLLVLAQVDSPEPMGFSVRQGAHFAFRADRVSPLVLTAFAEPSRRAAMMAQMLAGDTRAAARAALARRLESIRRRGYEQRRSDTTPGITDLCFPILDHPGWAVATLAQPYLAQRDVTMTVAQARERQGLAAAEISRELGARAPLSPGGTASRTRP